MSHDLRSPLTAIKVAAESLVEPGLALAPADRAELLETVRLGADRLERVVGNLLDLSRLQAGAAQPNREVWAVEELLAQAVEQLGESAQRVELVLPAEAAFVGGRRRPDRARARQPARERPRVLDSGRGPVTARTTTTRSDVLIRIVDRGPGIPETDLERIFEAFRSGPRRDDRGQGLGLTIARVSPSRNGGRLWAESRQGQGATFVLALPIAVVPAPAPA